MVKGPAKSIMDNRKSKHSLFAKLWKKTTGSSLTNSIAVFWIQPNRMYFAVFFQCLESSKAPCSNQKGRCSLGIKRKCRNLCHLPFIVSRYFMQFCPFLVLKVGHPKGHFIFQHLPTIDFQGELLVSGRVIPHVSLQWSRVETCDVLALCIFCWGGALVQKFTPQKNPRVYLPRKLIYTIKDHGWKMNFHVHRIHVWHIYLHIPQKSTKCS